MNPPKDIQIIGREVAILWEGGREDYYPMETLRACSPSAENVGERDILGNLYGGDGPREFPGVEVKRWEYVGNYAIRFHFSDDHRTGIYSYEYLQQIGDELKGRDKTETA